jgi:hypothetical protein
MGRDDCDYVFDVSGRNCRGEEFLQEFTKLSGLRRVELSGNGGLSIELAHLRQNLPAEKK